MKYTTLHFCWCILIKVWICYNVSLRGKVAELDNKESSVLVRKDNKSSRCLQFNAQPRNAFQRAQVIFPTSFHFVLLN